MSGETLPAWEHMASQWMAMHRVVIQQNDNHAAYDTPVQAQANTAALTFVNNRARFMQTRLTGKGAQKSSALGDFIEHRNKTAAVLDRIFQMRTEQMQDLHRITGDMPQQADANNNVTDQDVLGMGVLIMHTPQTPHAIISKNVNIPAPISTSSEALAKHCDLVCRRCTFAKNDVPHTEVLKIDGRVSVRLAKPVNLVDLCNNMPTSFSPSFNMHERNIENVKQAVAHATQRRNLHVYACDVNVDTNAQKRLLRVMLLPRQVGNNMLCHTSHFACVLDATGQTDAAKKLHTSTRHALSATSMSKKHPRFGINMGVYADELAAQTHDTALACSRQWVQKICGNMDKSLYKTLATQGALPQPRLRDTKHCCYMDADLGVTMMIQNNKYDCSAPALARYGLDTGSSASVSVDTVTIFFHGPTKQY